MIRTDTAAPETTRRPRGLRNDIVSGLGRLYGPSQTGPPKEIPEGLEDSSQRPRNRYALPSRDRSVETTRTRYDTRGSPRGRRVVSGAAMSICITPTSGVANRRGSGHCPAPGRLRPLYWGLTPFETPSKPWHSCPGGGAVASPFQDTL